MIALQFDWPVIKISQFTNPGLQIKTMNKIIFKCDTDSLLHICYLCHIV